MKILRWKSINEFRERFPARDKFTKETSSDLSKDVQELINKSDDKEKTRMEIYNRYNHELFQLEKKSNEEPTFIGWHLIHLGFSSKEIFELFNQKQMAYFWLYKGDIYAFIETNTITSEYSKQQLLIFEFFDKDRRKWEKLNRLYKNAQTKLDSNIRERIPEEVRIAVWRRDEGKCAHCGSREKLEYDHIVPISKGGSNTVRNIELLCEKCNREKSNNIQ